MREPFKAYMEREMGQRVVLIACGLPASYKTETTEVIAAIKGYVVLRTDMLRLEVLRNEDIFDEKVASSMNKRTAVYDEMFKMARLFACRGQGVILDATFVTQALRRRAAEVASACGMTLVIQQTQCPKEVSIRRILLRSKENYESNALTEQAYMNNVNRFEAVDLKDLRATFPGLPLLHLQVDTASDSMDEWVVIERTDL